MSRANADLGQPSTRRPGTFYDQHVIPGHPLFSQGRPWQATVEKSTGFPVGAIKPKGWRAPWIPPQGPEVFVFDKDNPTRFVLNYEYLLAQRVKDMEEKIAERQSAAVVRSWDPMDPEKQDALDKITGPIDAMNRPEVIAACIQGDHWVLGATPVVNPKVQAFLPKKQTRIQKIMANMPDFSVEPEGESLADDLEALMDIEESVDAGATPRGRVPVKPKARKPKTEAVA